MVLIPPCHVEKKKKFIFHTFQKSCKSSTPVNWSVYNECNLDQASGKFQHTNWRVFLSGYYLREGINSTLSFSIFYKTVLCWYKLCFMKRDSLMINGTSATFIKFFSP